MSQLAFLFPGQASQYPGMGKELAEKFPQARAVFDEADEALGLSISKLCFEGPEEELKLTANTQPAILACSIAAYRLLAGKSVRPDYVAGHSLGEYSALVASECLTLKDAVRLVRKRGQFMQEAVPVGQGAMAAILGLAQAQVEDICEQAAEGEVVIPANLNSPEQIVISGHATAVKRALEIASTRGAKRAVLLPVSAPFHSELMQPAQARLEVELWQTGFSNLEIPLVTNVDAEIIEGPEEARDALIRQVSAPVRWEESIRLLIEKGVGRFVEVGPGKVLSGLLRQIDRSVISYNVEDEKSLLTTVEKLAHVAEETS
jgi:[acyl-carrier-protein] S-malonyltransferase